MASYSCTRIESLILPNSWHSPYFSPLTAEYGSNNVFIPNGSRAYLDVGGHPEYATAECDSLRQLLSYEQAGDFLFAQLVRDCSKNFHDANQPGDLFVFKNNIDSLGNTFGCHENYLIERSLNVQKLSRTLIPFLVTRQMLCGSGSIFTDPATGKTRYILSQRAHAMDEGISSATTRARPMINTRDEPHADPGLYRRLHVIVGDSNMSQYSTFVKIGTTTLVLEMIEAGVDLAHFALQDPAQAIKDTSDSLHKEVRLTLADGDSVTPLEMQWHFLRCAQQWVHNDRPTNESGTPLSDLEQVLEVWEKILQAWEKQDFSHIDTTIDWVIKNRLLEDLRQAKSLDYDSAELAQIDLHYHDILPERGLFYLLKRQGRVEDMLDVEEIEAATSQPPATTRALLRGEFIDTTHQLAIPTIIDWSRLNASAVGEDEHGTEIILNDPFQTHSRELERFRMKCEHVSEDDGRIADGL